MGKFIIFACILSSILTVKSVSFVNYDHVKFPDDFMFGVSTSSYQIEGAWNVDGRGESIWDRVVHSNPEEVLDMTNADETTQSYYMYKRDIGMLEELGVGYYRFSMSWCRILPKGRIHEINHKGLQYYDMFIDELLSKNITPMVTLYHWDLPQVLQDEGGLLNPGFPEWFEDYVRLIFSYYGDKVKYWLTFNEPREICLHGYGKRLKAPQLNQHGYGEYKCIANLLSAHAKVYHLYNNTFRLTQKGKVGITITADWGQPKTDSELDKKATIDGIQFHLGLFAHQIFSNDGGYPPEVKAKVPSDRLLEPRKSPPVKGTYDFIGLNHYDTVLVGVNDINLKWPKPSFDDDLNINEVDVRRWSKLWLQLSPTSFGQMLDWIKKNYNDPEIIITENGMSSGPGIVDKTRAWYFKRFLTSILAARQRGVKVIGYFPWTLMDNFEWLKGYTERYGLYEVDIKSPNKTRTPRLSALVYKEIIKSKSVDPDYMIDTEPGVPQESFSVYKFVPEFSKKKSWKKISAEEVPLNKTKEAFVLEKIVDSLNSQILTFNRPFD